MSQIYVYHIPVIPDFTDHRLVSLYQGEVKKHIWQAHEQILRIISNFQEKQLTLGIRYKFNPETTHGLQSRLNIQLCVKTADDVSEDLVKQLIDYGPLSDFYQKQCSEPSCHAINNFRATHCHKCGNAFNLKNKTDTAFPAFPFICEIIRREDTIEIELPRELNPNVPQSGFYYSISPFEPNTENDYLLLDNVLSRMEYPCMVELLVSPVDHSQDFQWHYKYLRQIMAINQYGNSIYQGDQEETPISHLTARDYLTRRQLEYDNKKDPLANDIVRMLQDIHERLQQPQLLFNAKVFGMSRENVLMITSSVAESGFLEGKYRMILYDEQSPGDILRLSHKNSQHLDISSDIANSPIWNTELPEGWKNLKRLCHMATIEELSGAVRLPVGGYVSPLCIRKKTDPQEEDFAGTILIGDDLESGAPTNRIYPDSIAELIENRSPHHREICLTVDNLTKHMFVTGSPGSGKTTALFNILVQLYKNEIPFLVLEPVKIEYRALKTLQNHPDPLIRDFARELRIYSAGHEDISPLRYNPLEYPDGITLDEHIGQVLACFEAAFPMGGPLNALIAEAVEAVYEKAKEKTFPTILDLFGVASEIFEKMKYAGEVRSNVMGALEVRLGSLTRRSIGRIFQCRNNIPSFEDMLNHPTIIEMDYLPRDQACLLTLFLLTSLREHIKIDAQRLQPGLHHVTVVEEAHNIVGRSGEAIATENSTNPKAFAAEYISRMLAEVRALGEGIIIADQLPSAVAPEVVKNTSTKLVHRLVSNEDREDIGGTMLFGKLEHEEVARLSPGEAYFYTEGMYRPRLIRGLNPHTFLHFGVTPLRTAIVNDLINNYWYKRDKVLRAVDALFVFKNYMNEMKVFLERKKRSFESEKIVPHEINFANRLEDALTRREKLKLFLHLLVEEQNELHTVVIKDYYLKRIARLKPVIVEGSRISPQIAVDAKQIEEQCDKEAYVFYKDLFDRFSKTIEKVRNLL